MLTQLALRQHDIGEEENVYSRLKSQIDRFNERITAVLEQEKPNNNQPIKACRKLCEKILKVLKIQTILMATEIREDKETLKSWFRQQINNDQLRESIYEKVKKWVINQMKSISFEETQIIVQKYLKSLMKEKHKKSNQRNVQGDQGASIKVRNTLETKEQQEGNVAMILCSEAPGSRYKKFQEQTDTQNLIPIPIVFKFRNKKYLENLYYDALNDQNNEEIDKLSFHFTRDWLIHRNFPNLEQKEFEQLYLSFKKQLHDGLSKEDVVIKYKIFLCQFQQSAMGKDVFEDLISIRIKLQDTKSVFYEQTFDWDVSQEGNNPDNFAEIMVADLGINERYVKDIARQIREQIVKHLSVRLNHLSNLYPQHNQTNSGDSLSRFEEQRWMKKNSIHSLNESLTQLPQNYESRKEVVKLQNQEMMSLFQNYLDVVPSDFKKQFFSLQSIEVKRQAEIRSQSQKQEFFSVANKLQLPFKENPYIPKFLYRPKKDEDEEIQRIIDQSFDPQLF